MNVKTNLSKGNWGPIKSSHKKLWKLPSGLKLGGGGGLIQSIVKEQLTQTISATRKQHYISLAYMSNN